MTTPLPKPYRQVQQSLDDELRKILELAATRIRRRIESLGDGIGAEVRAAQLRLVLAEIGRIVNATWAGPILDATTTGRKAAAEAAENASEALTAIAYAALPPDVAQALVDGLEASARSAIENAYAHTPRELSRRVYRWADLDARNVQNTIRAGLASGLTAKELSREVYQYVSPTAPGGMSYAAMRLARTEINNAFHERQIAGAKRPGVKAVQWNLSGSHKVPDECNVYAAHEPYSPDDVPDKPHPQCFCYLTYVMMTSDEFSTALSAGDFDDELDRRTRENMARLGREATPKPSPKADRPTPAAKREATPSDDPLNRTTGDVSDSVQAALDRNRQLVPSAFAERFNGIYVMDAKQAKAFTNRFGVSALGGYTVESAEVGIHPQVLKPAYAKQYARDVASGFLSRAGDDPVLSFVAHETGHHVDRVMRERDPKRVKVVWAVIAEQLGVSRPLLTDQSSLDRWVLKNKDAVANAVSRYGSEDSAELIAEVWAEYVAGDNPRPAIKAIGDAIRVAVEGEDEQPQPEEPRERPVNVLPRFKATFAQPWQTESSIDRRVGGLWSHSFFGMNAVRTAMRNRRANRDLMEDIPLQRGRLTVFRDREDEEDPDSPSLYSEDDFRNDVANAVDMWEHRLTTAPATKAVLYRGIRVPKDKMFSVGDVFSSDIASWTEQRDWAEVYANTEDNSTGHVGEYSVIMRLAGKKHSVDIDDIAGPQQQGSKEHIARGQYRVVKVTGKGRKFVVHLEEIGRNNPPS